MDLKQMYAKGRKKRDFDVDELFIQQLLELPYEVGVSVVDKLKKNSHTLLSEDGWTALKAGVIKGEKPYFFQVEYVTNTGNPPLILDIEEIDCDTFLDFINAKQILK